MGENSFSVTRPVAVWRVSRLLLMGSEMVQPHSLVARQIRFSLLLSSRISLCVRDFRCPTVLCVSV